MAWLMAWLKIPVNLYGSSSLRAFPMGLPKVKINSNMANKSKKWLLMDELHIGQNKNMLQCQVIYTLHCSLGKWIFYCFFYFNPFVYSALSSALSLSLFSLIGPLSFSLLSHWLTRSDLTWPIAVHLTLIVRRRDCSPPLQLARRVIILRQWWCGQDETRSLRCNKTSKSKK